MRANTRRFERSADVDVRAPFALSNRKSQIVNRKSPRGSILIGLLWCVALLAVVVIGLLHTARLDLMVGKNYGDRIQAHYLALAGIEKTKALLYEEAAERKRSRVNHSGRYYNSPADFREVTLGRGQFQILRPGRADEGGGIIYGVSDEESRLNLNTAATEELARLEGLTPDVVAAINDWRDGDNAASPSGAEVDYYASLRPPYQPRNGPFQTVRELLMVRGFPRERLGGDGPAAADGWARLFTVSSAVENVNAAGETRVNVQTADESSLTGIRGITAEIARAIVSSRGQSELKSVADLLDVSASQNQGGPREGPGNNPPGRGQPNQPQPGGNASGPGLIDEQLLMDIADDVTAVDETTLTGAVNVNTASLEVLACLPGLDRDLAQAIISFRQSNGYLPNVAWLLKVPGITRDLLKQLAPRVTVRSETYRILCEGRVKSSGVRQRIQAVVRVGASGVATLGYREDDL